MGVVSKRGEDDEEPGEVSIAGLEDLDGKADESVYELDEWSERSLALLRERLTTLGVPHTWEDDTNLVISEVDDAWVERIMDQVEDDLSVALDPDVSQVAYDLSAWDHISRDGLFDILEDEAVPYGMDGDELYVHEIDEARVDEIIEAIVNPPAEPSPEPAAGPDVMGPLFVAADRLVHDPGDHGGTLALIEAVRLAGSAPAPYGMDPAWWDGVLASADELVERLDASEPEEDAVVDAATALRTTLRPFV
ncbi:MAG: hypothetical protein ABWZ76_11725 [Acidimicrobiales bacterium]